jgi:hypothetical protein
VIQSTCRTAGGRTGGSSEPLGERPASRASVSRAKVRDASSRPATGIRSPRPRGRREDELPGGLGHQRARSSASFSSAPPSAGRSCPGRSGTAAEQAATFPSSELPRCGTNPRHSVRRGAIDPIVGDEGAREVGRCARRAGARAPPHGDQRDIGGEPPVEIAAGRTAPDAQMGLPTIWDGPRMRRRHRPPPPARAGKTSARAARRRAERIAVRPGRASLAVEVGDMRPICARSPLPIRNRA